MDKPQMLQLLNEQVSNCSRCDELSCRRTQTVFGNGNPDAAVLFLGEAPGENEDKQGLPFVGRAGELLDNMIRACGWTREQVYVCNVLKCRPPNNRTPNEQEIRNCRAYLDLQIRVINPAFIVCLGGVAAQTLLGVKSGITRLRGRLFHHQGRKVICTYHPSFLLRGTDQERKAKRQEAADDLRFLLDSMQGAW